MTVGARRRLGKPMPGWELGAGSPPPGEQRGLSLGGRWSGPGVICADFECMPAEKNGLAGATCQHLREMG